MKNLVGISVIIPVKNEEENLPICLKKLGRFSEVIVVDSSSTDGTRRIVEEHGFRYENFIWNGQFPKKRNWALRNLKIENDWVLFLDADEFISEEFVNEIFQKTNIEKMSGYWIRYNNHFLGKMLKHGDSMKKLALFRKSSGEYEKIEEDKWSSLDMEIHEHPILDGKVGNIEAQIDHIDFKGIKKYIERHNNYSTWESNRYVELKKNKNKGLNLRQKIKYGMVRNTCFAPAYFFVSFIWMRGFLDGKEGLLFALFKAKYFLDIKCKIDEIVGQKL